jgi:hypothetical protein
VQVAYSEYLSNPLVEETESTMMLKSWEEYEAIFQTVWGMAKCKMKVNELLQISDQRNWSSAAAGGLLKPLDRNIQRVPQNDLKRIQPRESAGNPADITLQCKSCDRDFLFTAEQQASFKENGWVNNPGKCDKCKPCNQHFKGAGCQFGADCKFSHDAKHRPFGELIPGSIDTPCKHFKTGNCMSGDKCPFQHDKKGDEVPEEGFAGLAVPGSKSVRFNH